MSYPSCVYRFFSGDGELLYVGCTGRLTQRITNHASSKHWFADVATVTVQHFNNRAEALAVEAAAIDTESPRYNTDHAAAVRNGALLRQARRLAAHERGEDCRDRSCRACRNQAAI